MKLQHKEMESLKISVVLVHNQFICVLPFSDTRKLLLTPVVSFALKNVNGESAHLKHMYSLLLDRQHSQDVPVEVEALVMGQDNLVTFEGPGVTQPASVEVNNV